jgi:hypothetical protein
MHFLCPQNGIKAFKMDVSFKSFNAGMDQMKYREGRRQKTRSAGAGVNRVRNRDVT